MYLNWGVVLNGKGGGSGLSPDPWFRYTAYNHVLIYGAGLLKHNPTIMYDHRMLCGAHGYGWHGILNHSFTYDQGTGGSFQWLKRLNHFFAFERGHMAICPGA